MDLIDNEQDIVRAFVVLNLMVDHVNIANDWHTTKRSFGDSCALLHTEVSELYEWHRKPIDHPLGLMSDHIPDFTGEAEELADIIIRVLDTATRHDIQGVPEAVIAKLKFNLTRGRRHGGKVI